MTDWDEFRENIARAMRASSQFHKIGEALIEAPDKVDIREFATRMVALQQELEDILALVAPGSTVALDEIVDAFSRAIYGHPTSFRVTPRGPSKDD
ncbi:MAG TPA: hypothetical protein VJ768_01355 [Anaerolineales bacterium]|nr:hypothetical protein [Anaerolineales bacterium]